MAIFNETKGLKSIVFLDNKLILDPSLLVP